MKEQRKKKTEAPKTKPFSICFSTEYNLFMFRSYFCTFCLIFYTQKIQNFCATIQSFLGYFGSIFYTKATQKNNIYNFVFNILNHFSYPNTKMILILERLALKININMKIKMNIKSDTNNFWKLHKSSNPLRTILFNKK